MIDNVKARAHMYYENFFCLSLKEKIETFTAMPILIFCVLFYFLFYTIECLFMLLAGLFLCLRSFCKEIFKI
jgi:hypothetical protein